ncbi:ATP-dependent endonuclease [Rhizobium sp. L1K21]|uniref:ATP-dependent nuclease n=1 Tax=Rhizobium sp. L1K21 TaxID=2954933 RepID=UPI0020920940|nr:AAA family ATPase [Rhizobium sp. L1K21]MCO6187485.1 AAA family ATPase [Rhizobium sp. L1K21]
MVDDEKKKEPQKPLTVRRLMIENFRGVARGQVDFSGHTLLVGGNNVGKSTICDALELVLGPERAFRRPIVNEHDFHSGQYLDENGVPIYIKIDVVLLHLPEEMEKRLFSKTRPWSDKKGGFVDVEGAKPEDADAEDVCRALPLSFIGYYNRQEDDFAGGTYFSHPIQEIGEDDEQFGKPFAGLSYFPREWKIQCGFIYLRTLRTGRRALSLERGSLLDTILRLGDSGKESMWESTVKQIRALKPAIGDIPQLEEIQKQIRNRMSRFVGLSSDADATGFFASDLTREHLREVVQLFLKSKESNHSVPYSRLGTGAVNALVFALLTHIADLRGNRAVIFAMEEPEIALPPHAQRRITKYLLSNMGQAIITSHSPYVIEEFELTNVNAVSRQNAVLSSDSIPTDAIKYRTLRSNRRQLAEAVLARGIIVAEGDTEAKMLLAATYAFEKLDPSNEYVPLDIVGVSIFDAGSQSNIPRWGPFFNALNKVTFAFHDQPNAAWTEDQSANLATYQYNFETNYKGTEYLLIEEVPVSVLRRFLTRVSEHPDYPTEKGYLNNAPNDEEVKKLAKEVLKAKKGSGFAAMVIEECQALEELPKSVKEFLTRVAKDMALPKLEGEGTDEAGKEGDQLNGLLW